MNEAAAAVETEPKPETFMKTMEVDVTAEEQNQRKDRLVAVDREIINVEAEKASKSSDFSTQIKTLKKERVALLQAIGTGRERREIPCYLERDDRLGVMRTKRVDTDAVIDERALTLEERQTELFDDDEAKTDDGDTERPPAGDGDEPEQVGSAGPDAEDDAPPTDADGAGDGEAEGDAEQATTAPTGKVTRIKASDVRKKAAERKRKANQAAEAGESDGAA